MLCAPLCVPHISAQTIKTMKGLLSLCVLILYLASGSVLIEIQGSIIQLLVSQREELAAVTRTRLTAHYKIFTM
jgi:hypothetical protein